MSYTKTTWENLPSTNTPINATNLNHIETGIKDNEDNINDTKKVELYFDATGTREATINGLSNYSYVDVELRTTNYTRKTVVRIYLDSSGYNANFTICYFPYSDTLQQICADLVYNGSNKLTLANEYYISYDITDKNIKASGDLTYLRIVKVYGYK